MEISQLETKNRDELVEIAKEMGLSNYANSKKQDIIMRLLQANAEHQGKALKPPGASARRGRKAPSTSFARGSGK